MHEIRPQITLARHGETEWSAALKHTSVTDLPLTENGEFAAADIARRLTSPYARTATSPRLRAQQTARLAGFAEAEVWPDLAEWNYGDYEGLTTQEIRQSVPGWSVWTHSCPGGESLDQVAQRAHAVVAEVLTSPGPVLLFSHGHFLRVLAATWLGLGPQVGQALALDTASVSILGWEREHRVLRRWNA